MVWHTYCHLMRKQKRKTRCSSLLVSHVCMLCLFYVILFVHPSTLFCPDHWGEIGEIHNVHERDLCHEVSGCISWVDKKIEEGDNWGLTSGDRRTSEAWDLGTEDWGPLQTLHRHYTRTLAPHNRADTAHPKHQARAQSSSWELCLVHTITLCRLPTGITT